MLLLIMLASAGTFATNPMCWTEPRIVHPEEGVEEAISRRSDAAVCATVRAPQVGARVGLPDPPSKKEEATR